MIWLIGVRLRGSPGGIRLATSELTGQQGLDDGNGSRPNLKVKTIKL